MNPSKLQVSSLFPAGRRRLEKRQNSDPIIASDYNIEKFRNTPVIIHRIPSPIVDTEKKRHIGEKEHNRA